MINELSDRINEKVHFPFALQIFGPMYCSTALLVSDKETMYPLPEAYLPLNVTKSTVPSLWSRVSEAACLNVGHDKRKSYVFVFKEMKLFEQPKPSIER